MGIMTFGAFIICSFERRLGRPLTAPHPVGAALPVFIDQAVAAGAHFFHIDMHDSGSVIGHILVAVLDEMTIEAAVIGAVI